MKWAFLLLTLFLRSVHGQGDEPPRAAKQVGVSCAFYGNVPALSWHTGIDISQATEFIRPIYGLHRGDFNFSRSFQKMTFYELFNILYTSSEVIHADLPKEELLGKVEKLIVEVFDAGLKKGHLYSLRSRGIFGGPHNTLLLGKNDQNYQLHDPFRGEIQRIGRAELAAKILIATSETKNDNQPRYLTNYLTIPTSPEPIKPIKLLSQLPDTLQIKLTESQRKSIQQGLRSSESIPENQDLKLMVKHFPLLDFAMVPSNENNETLVSAINPTLKDEQLVGLIRLAQFHLNVWQLGHRDCLSVLFLNGAPQAFVGYRKSSEGMKFLFDNGTATSEHATREVLKQLSIHAPVHATIQVAQQNPPSQ
jgi:hypothetical protein